MFFFRKAIFHLVAPLANNLNIAQIRWLVVGCIHYKLELVLIPNPTLSCPSVIQSNVDVGCINETDKM